MSGRKVDIVGVEEVGAVGGIDEGTDRRLRFDRSRINVPMEFGDVLVCLFLIAVAGWFFVTSNSIPDYSGTLVGPDDFPRGLAVIFAAFTAILLATAGMRIARGRLDGAMIEIERPLRVVCGMGLLLLFPAMMDNLGFYLAMGLWLPAFFVVSDYPRPLEIVFYTAGFLLFTKLFFQMFLGTPLP